MNPGKEVRKEVISNTPLVAPDTDVEPVAKPPVAFFTNLDDPGDLFPKLFLRNPLWH